MEPATGAEESAKFEAEAAKLRAEAAKLQAEKEKLAAEQKHLERPVWQRTEVVGIAGSILVAAIGLGGVIWTQSIRDKIFELDRKTQQLEEQKNQTKEAQKNLQDEEAKLQPTINDLTERKALLESNLASLAERSLASDERIAAQTDKLRQLNDDIQRLHNDVEFGQLDSLVVALQKHYEHSSHESPIEWAITDLLEKATATDQQKWAERIEKTASDAAIPLRLRMVLYRTLWRGTKRTWYRYELVRFAHDHFFDFDETDVKVRHEDISIIDVVILGELDSSDRRFLAESLWEDLKTGTRLHEAFTGNLLSFLELSEEAELDFPEAFFRPLAELQQRLVSSTDRYEIESLGEKLSALSPQCFVLTWYFGSMDEQSKQLLSKRETETENKIMSTWNYRAGIGLPYRAIPVGDKLSPTPENWKKLNPRLTEFCVPINYDSRMYDPLRRVVKGVPIVETDIPSTNLTSTTGWSYSNWIRCVCGNLH